MNEHTENWLGFATEVDGQDVLIKVDLGWASEDPARGCRTRLHVTVPTPDVPRDELDGFLEQVDPFEETLVETFAPAVRGYLVGTILDSKERTWVFYAANPSVAAASLAKAAKAWKGPTPGLKTEDDADWEFYQEVLTPTSDQYRYYSDLSVVEQLESHGDTGEKPRLIEHFAIFPDTDARDEFVEWCRENGYSVTEAGDYDEEFDGCTVTFTHVGPATIDEIYERTSVANEAAEDLGGQYDGWECEVVG